MKHIILSKKNWKKVLDESVRVLQKGGVIVYPTETSYGIGADATNKKAMQKVFRIKGRETGKPLSVLMASQRMTKEYAHLSSDALRLWKKFFPGALTIIVRGKGEAPVGVRVSSHPFARALVRSFGRPVTATSANRSGTPSLLDPNAIVRTFFFQQVKPDLVINAGVLPKHPASTVVDCTGKSVRILRKGPITETHIKKVLT